MYDEGHGADQRIGNMLALAGRRRPSQPGGHRGDVGRSGDVVRLWCTSSPGELSGAESRHDPHRSVLTRAVGVGPTVDVDAVVQPVVPGDWLLLCTDGVTNEVGQDQRSATPPTRSWNSP